MKFRVNSYHMDLLRDYERLSAFKEAIDDFASNNPDSCGLALDLGCGSGILSYFASKYFDKVVSIEKNPSTARLARENLERFDNVEFYNFDVFEFDFDLLDGKPDLVICEMMDTALIDEEEIPVLNHIRQYLTENTKIIPEGIINMAEPVFMQKDYLQYEDDESHPVYTVLGNSITCSEFDFKDEIDEKISCILELNIFDTESYMENMIFENKEKSPFSNKNDEMNLLKVNGIKLTSFTKISQDILCGPTPMFNPSLLIPIEDVEIEFGGNLKVELSYVMGGGIESIKTKVVK